MQQNPREGPFPRRPSVLFSGDQGNPSTGPRYIRAIISGSRGADGAGVRGGAPVTSVRLLENRREPPQLRERPAHRGALEWTPPPGHPCSLPPSPFPCRLFPPASWRQSSFQLSPVGTFESSAEARGSELPACPLRSAWHSHFSLRFRLSAHDHASIQNQPRHTLLLPSSQFSL